MSEESDVSRMSERKGGKYGPQKFVVALVIVACVIVFGVRWWLDVRSHVTTDDAVVDATMVQVGPEVGGRIQQVLADTGDRVTKGKILARLETEEPKANVAKAAAAAEARWKDVLQAERALNYESEQTNSRIVGAEAAAKRTDLQVRQSVKAAELEKQLIANGRRQAGAALTAAKADSIRVQTDLARMENLFSQGAVSAQQRDAAVNAAANAQARLQAAEAEAASAEAETAQIDIKQRDIQVSRTTAQEAAASLSSARAGHLQVALRRAQLESALAQAKEADEALRLARIALKNTEIRSPAAGTIAQKLVDSGEMVATGQPLFTITRDVDGSDISVIANLEETKIWRIEVGQTAEFTVDAYPGVHFQGRVVEIRAGTESQFSLIPAQQPSGSFTKVTQRIPVKIAVISDKGYRLSPGMSAVVRIDVDSAHRTKSQTEATKAIRGS